MSDPVETVERFCATWDQGMDRVHAAVRRYFTPETVWDNVGWSVTTGADEAIALWDTFALRGFPFIRVEMIHIAAAGHVVLTERVDHLLDADRRLVLSARLMGVFEIAGGKIAAWRDYTDPAVLAAIPRD